MHQKVTLSTKNPDKPIKGHAGLNSQCMGQPLTVSSIATATGGIGNGNLIILSN